MNWKRIYEEAMSEFSNEFFNEICSGDTLKKRGYEYVTRQLLSQFKDTDPEAVNFFYE